MSDLRSKTSMAIIKGARKVFYNTPVQRWKITSMIYDRIFHAGYNKEELEAHYFGVDLKFPGRDFTITPGLMGGFYEKFEIEIFEEICKSSKNVIDVGGNIGLYSCIAAKNGCKVEVFEPVPENQKYLKYNIDKNGLVDRINLHKFAVGNKNEKGKINLSLHNIGTHSLAKVEETSGSINIKVVTLDTYLNNKKYDVLKVDVEGYDGFVLDGAQKIIAKYSPTLFIEMVPKHLLSADYNPIKFVEFITSQYKNVFAVDDVNSQCLKVNRDILVRYIQAGRNVNLVATNKSTHHSIIQRRTK